MHPLAGRPQKPEHIARRVAARRANNTYAGWAGPTENIHRLTPEQARAMALAHGTGPGHPRWSGDEVGSRGAHARARRRLEGSPCLHCGSTTKVMAALITGCGNRVDPVHGPYSVLATDYIPLCPSCHKRYDNAARDD